MKRGRKPIIWDYGWREAQCDLEEGVRLSVVALRLGEPEDFVREVAEQQGWPVVYDDGPLTRLH